MSNVIRPTFGKPSVAPVTDMSEEHRPLRVFGAAAGHVVALIRDDSAPEGPAFRVVVGPTSSNVVETVAVIPAEPKNETDADAIGFAVVRALEIVEDGTEPESA